MLASVRQVVGRTAPAVLRTVLPALTRKPLVGQLGAQRLLFSMRQLPQASAALAARRVQPFLAEASRRLLGEPPFVFFSSVESSVARFFSPPQRAEVPRALPSQLPWRERFYLGGFVGWIDALPESGPEGGGGKECREMGEELRAKLRSLQFLAFKFPKGSSKEQICSLLRGLGEESVRFEFMCNAYHETENYRWRIDSSWWRPSASIDLETLEGSIVLERALAEGRPLPHDTYHFGCRLSKLSDEQLDRFAELITSDHNAVYMRLLHPPRSWKSNVLFGRYTAFIRTFPQSTSECYEMGKGLCELLRDGRTIFASPCSPRLYERVTPFSKEQLRSLLLGFEEDPIILECTEKETDLYDPQYVNLIGPQGAARLEKTYLARDSLPADACCFACQPSKLSEDQLNQLLEVVMSNPAYNIRHLHPSYYSKEEARSWLLSFGEKLVLIRVNRPRGHFHLTQCLDLTKATDISLLKKACQDKKSLHPTNDPFCFICRPSLLPEDQLDMLVDVVRFLPNMGPGSLLSSIVDPTLTKASSLDVGCRAF